MTERPIDYSHAEALDLLRTLFNELWDGAADFLEAINSILERTEGAREFQGGRITQREGVDLTWTAALEAWHDAKPEGRGIPERQAVLDRLTAVDEDLLDDNNELSVTLHVDLRITPTVEGGGYTPEALRESAVEAVNEALVHAMNRGFNHALSDVTSIHVDNVKAQEE